MSQSAMSSPLTTAVGRPLGPRYAALRKIRCHIALMSLASSPTIHGFRWWIASAIIRLPLPGKLVHSPQPWMPSSVRTRTNVQMSGYSTLLGVPPFDGSTVYTSTSTIFMRVGSLRSPTGRVLCWRHGGRAGGYQGTTSPPAARPSPGARALHCPHKQSSGDRPGGSPGRRGARDDDHDHTTDRQHRP